MIFLAHHLEPEHLPVVAAIFIAGFWLGRSIAAKVSSGQKSPPGPPGLA